MTDIRAPEAGILAAYSALAMQANVPEAGILATYNVPAQVNVPEAGGLVAYNVPSQNLAGTEAGIEVVFRQAATVAVAQAGILAAVRGRVANPVLRAWTFSLDGHDYYVLRLGDTSTLVYDCYSQQWVDWSDFQSLTWRAQCGMNWIGAQGLATGYGSDVVAGDDIYGLLWFLDPEQSFDDNPRQASTVQQLFFERIVMGQVPIRGREVLPCYAVWLTTDMGDPAYEGAGVTLSSSDDAGVTYDDHGIVTVTAGENSPELSWYSLGQIEAPGRLFKIFDDGAITRLDGMEMNDPDDKE
jgi:hypothetical protein